MAPPSSWRPMHPLIGRLLANRFQVASFVREGGMAQVFCGIQDDEPRHVAIKVVHPELAENPEMVARFLREAEVAAKLVHPNIVRIVDVGEDGDLLSAAASAAASVDRRLQHRVDSLGRTRRVLMVLVVVAFSVIAVLVVALLVKGKGR